jgi:hypothetical protein
VYHNASRSGYFVVANCASTAGQLDLQSPQRCWDVAQQKIVRLKRLKLEPLSVSLFRVLTGDSVLLDVRNSILLQSITEAAGSTRIRGMFHHESELLLTKCPKAIQWNGAPLALPRPKRIARAWSVSISGLPAEDGELEIAY